MCEAHVLSQSVTIRVCAISGGTIIYYYYYYYFVVTLSLSFSFQ